MSWAIGDRVVLEPPVVDEDSGEYKYSEDVKRFTVVSSECGHLWHPKMHGTIDVAEPDSEHDVMVKWDPCSNFAQDAHSHYINVYWLRREPEPPTKNIHEIEAWLNE